MKANKLINTNCNTIYIYSSFDYLIKTTINKMQNENIFYSISKSLIPIPNNYFVEKTGDTLLIFLFNSYHTKKCANPSYSKFDFLQTNLKNPFFNTAQVTLFEECFSRVQKTRFAFSRLAYMWKMKKSKTVVDTDLGLNLIDHNANDVVILLQNNNKYYFRINDLINLIQGNLSNSHQFFSEPLVSKNPFNNIPFNKSTLYNIYFTIREKSAILPELFHKFFLSNFNMPKFIEKYEYLIREHAIARYVKTGSLDNLTNYINDMIIDCGYHSKIYIDDDFPDDLLVQIMRPYLKLYLLSCYSLVTLNKMRTRNLLAVKLERFANYNPSFGRKILTSTKYYCNKKHKYKTKIEISFSDTHIDFDEEDCNTKSCNRLNTERKKVNDFLSSHLQV